MNQKAFALFCFIFSALFSDEDLEKKSFLYKSQQLLKIVSKEKTTDYPFSQTKQVIDLAPCWIDVDLSLPLDKLFKTYQLIGIKGIFIPKMNKTIYDVAEKYNRVLIKDPLFFEGQSIDFNLALRNYDNYRRIFQLVEIKDIDWETLPLEPEPVDLTSDQIHTLKTKGYFEDVNHYPIAATPPILGIDGTLRRWVYPHIKGQKIALLNFYDPSFLANQILSGKILFSLQNHFKILEVNSEDLLLTKNNYPLSLHTSETIGILTRKFGGYTFQNLDLPFEQIPPYLSSAQDLILSPSFQIGLIEAFLHKDTTLLKWIYKDLLKNGLQPYFFIHSQYDKTPISYQLNTFKSAPFSRHKIVDDHLNFLNEKRYPYLKITDNKLLISNIGLCAAALNIKNPSSVPVEKIEKAHFLLTFFNAMQPGVFFLSSQDLQGTYNTYTNDVIKCHRLYSSPLKGNAYVKYLMQLIKTRSVYHLDKATLISIPLTQNKEVLVLVYKDPVSNARLITAINFSLKPINETIEDDSLFETYGIDLIEDQGISKVYKSKKVSFDLAPLSGKCLAFYKNAIDH